MPEITSRPDAVLQRELVPKLAKRAYHLKPSNTWFQDWIQYQRNTHPIFGICFHHPLHPMGAPHRLFALLGSIAVGLIITNLAYLSFLKDLEEIVDGNVGTFNINQVNVDQLNINIDVDYEVDSFQVILWVCGSFIHSCFDQFIWQFMSCKCCRPGGCAVEGNCCCNTCCQKFGLYSSTLVVGGAVLVAIGLTLFNFDKMEKHESDYESDLTSKLVDPTSKYYFLFVYAIELVLALFVFYTITSTVFFSGVLACFTGKVPIIGGRPRAIMKERKQASKVSAVAKQMDKGECQIVAV